MDDSSSPTVEQHVEHPRAVPEVLAAVRAQLLEAFAVPLFDGEKGVESSPIVKVGVTETGTIRVSARRVDPPYQADLTLHLRTDVEPVGDGHYRVCGHCELVQPASRPPLHHDFALKIAMNEDGALLVDVAALREEIAATIRAFET